MAEAAVSLAVETLANLLIEKAVFLIGVEGDVEWVRDQLKNMKCFLEDAAKKQSDSANIRKWISDIRELAHDAEDAIERFVLKVQSRGLLRRYACFPSHLSHLNNIGNEIESIRKRLKDIQSNRLTYGIQDLGESSRSRSQLVTDARLAYWKHDRDVVGLEEDVKLLLHRAILDESKGLSIASIIGMGGIGKSTLAKKIYNHPSIAGEFECRASVVVSSEFKAEDIMKQIVVELKILSEDLKRQLEFVDDATRRRILAKEVHSYLTGKRYLIVLDDVWEAAHWKSLSTCFPDEEDKASRLLLTSRNQVMKECCQFVHQIKVLDVNQSWELFMRKAFFDNTDSKCPEELQNIGEEILKWCGGLPLAICVIGGLLLEKTPYKSEWENVAKKMKSHLARNEGINTISDILELSYHNLHPELKACFLFLGFFKEDAVIEAKDVVHLWVAQGLVAQEVVREGETMEDFARNYLHQLISRNMVQVKSIKYDVVTECQMHDLLRDLSQRKAKEEINLEVLMGDSQHPLLHKPRHRVMHCSEVPSDSFTNQNQYLRSLFIIGEYVVSSSYWKSFELLRVLDLGNTMLEVLPTTIGVLTGLRYIKMRYVGPSSNLPRSWGKLTNLEVLHFLGHGSIIIDKVILKMKSLRHLYAFSLLCSEDVPLYKMKMLRTLTVFPLRRYKSVWQIQGMTAMTTLEFNMDKVTDASEFFTHLASLGNLVSLTLAFCDRLANMDGLSALNSITELKLGMLKRLPTNFPPKLSYLTLSQLELPLDQDLMPVLERIPELLYLKLNYVYGVEDMVITRHGFPSLKVLHFKGLSDIYNIRVEEGGMREIKHFFIHYCTGLDNIENLPEPLKSAAIYIDG